MPFGQLPPIGVEDGYMQQAGVALRRRRPAGAVPRVQGDVVMVAPGGEKYHTWHADVDFGLGPVSEAGGPGTRRIIAIDLAIDLMLHPAHLGQSP